MYKRETFYGFDIYEDELNAEYVVFKKGDTIHELFRGDKGDAYEYILKNKPKRKPMLRNDEGRYTERHEALERYAEQVANEICDMYSEEDIIDLDWLFQKKFGYYMMRRLRQESAEVV